tara:strand:- start:205 stop:750 length:546 start_codon:yes stop_codon:yes gene_type:complete
MKQLIFILFLFTTLAVFTDARANTNTVTSNTVSSTTVDKTPPTASAPPVTIMQNDSCQVPASIGIQSQILGIATAKGFKDIDCIKLKYSKLLYQYGMKIAAVNVLCTDPIVFQAMEKSGSPCPAGKGLIGQEAQDYWDKHPEERPDYKQWITKNNVVEETKADNDALKNFALMALSMLLIL